jgi:predicted component of type VI protein secretion system
MAKIIISQQGGGVREVELTQERLTIGRASQNDVVLVHRAVSGRHAVIACTDCDAFIEDLDSTNGTLVNGRPIKMHILQDRDIINLPDTQIEYIAEPAGGAPVAELLAARDNELDRELGSDFDAELDKELENGLENGLENNSGQARDGESLARPARASALALHPALIKVLNGVNVGKQLSLTKPLTTIGKPGLQVAVIQRRDAHYYLMHVEGQLLPMVNGEMIGEGPRLLLDGDRLELAGTAMAFIHRG